MPGSLKVLVLVRFEGFELDVRAGEFLQRRDGAITRLGEQPLRILLALLEKPGHVVHSEEIRRTWPNDTVVEFEHSTSAPR